MKYLVVLVAIALIGCSKREKELTFKVGSKVIFGDSIDTGGGMLGDIGFFAINNNQEVYIIDKAYKTIKMYSAEGKMIREYGKGEGVGPGELYNPDGIDVDQNNNVYVMDSQIRRVTIFDNEGSVRNIINSPFMAANIVATQPGVFYLTGLPLSYTGDLIYKYDINDKQNNDKPVFKFCERYDPGENIAWANNGARIGLEKDNNGNIYYNFPYPYEIRIFNPDGVLLNKYSRNIKNFKPPYYKTVNGVKINISDNVLLDPVFVTDEIIAYRVVQDELEKQYLDFYNLRTKKYIGTINSAELGVDKSFQIKGDKKGHIYYALTRPYPHVVKMELSIKE